MNFTRRPAGVPMRRAMRRHFARANERRFKRWQESKAVAELRAQSLARSARGNGTRCGRVWTKRHARVAARGIGIGGNVRAVARTLNLGKMALYRAREKDPHFAALWEDELQQRYRKLEMAVIERLTEGYDEPVFYQGKKTDKRRVYDHAVALKMIDMNARREMAQRDAEARREALIANGDTALAHSDKDLLLVEMMQRHRNRNPQEWDGDIHRTSGFNLAECPAYPGYHAAEG